MTDERATNERGELERYLDPVIEVYKKDVDRTLIRENLKLTVTQRVRNLEAFMRDVEKLQKAMREAKAARSAEAVRRSA